MTGIKKIEKKIANLDIDKIRKIFLILFIFTLPNSVAINNILLGILTILWIFTGDKKGTLNIIKTNPFVILVYLFFFTYFISLLWTQNHNWGFHIVRKETILLFIPIFMSLIKKDEVELLIKTFVFSMSLSEIISYSIKFELIPPMFNATIDDPTSFMSHISYNPFLAFTIYLITYYLFKGKESILVRLVSIFFIITMTINLFITGGRAGQIAYFILMALLILQFLKVNLKSISIILIGLPLIFFGAYSSSNIFKTRVDMAIHNTANYNNEKHTCVGVRIAYAQNCLTLIQKNPILGVGVGDYPTEYNKIHYKETPNIPTGVHPHNMYLFIWAQNGIFSLIALIALLLIQIRLGINNNHHLKYPMVALPILFATIMFSDCYLLGHYTTFLFVIFSAILYKGATWNDLKKS